MRLALLDAPRSHACIGAAHSVRSVVDCTATDATVPALIKAAASLRGVSANKKPFADSSIDDFAKLVLTSRGPAAMRYESTVGAGLPVIAALQRVVASADPVSRISGSFSGTLGYVMSGLQVRTMLPRTHAVTLPRQHTL